MSNSFQTSISKINSFQSVFLQSIPGFRIFKALRVYCTFPSFIYFHQYKCTSNVQPGRSGLLQSVVLSEWRGPPSTPASPSTEPGEFSFSELGGRWWGTWPRTWPRPWPRPGPWSWSSQPHTLHRTRRTSFFRAWRLPPLWWRAWPRPTKTLCICLTLLNLKMRRRIIKTLKTRRWINRLFGWQLFRDEKRYVQT